MNFLRNAPCGKCEYCKQRLDAHSGLKEFFGYDEFRIFDGVPMQQQAVEAAIRGESLLTIFPTGGGKSLTFQLPALMAGRNIHGLTVVISPLQSLMKDQVDNLADRGVTDAVTINGLLDPIERAMAIEQVAGGTANLLYIAPEMLRSKTIERLLLSRNVVRLSAEISVDEFLCTVEYDYPAFHLTMHCYLCSLIGEALHLNEHEAARWLTKEQLDSVKWLPADMKVIEDVRTIVWQYLESLDKGRL